MRIFSAARKDKTKGKYKHRAFLKATKYARKEDEYDRNLGTEGKNLAKQETEQSKLEKHFFVKTYPPGKKQERSDTTQRPIMKSSSHFMSAH